MAFDNPVFDWSFTAAADQTQFTIVKITADNTVGIASAAADKTVGVVQDKATTGTTTQVRVLGVSKVIAGGSVTAGAYITADSAGKAVATTTAGNRAIGIALAGAASGDIFPVLLTGPITV